VRQEHVRHAAAPELPVENVGVAKGGLQLVADALAHGGIGPRKSVVGASKCNGADPGRPRRHGPLDVAGHSNRQRSGMSPAPARS
jgi:hypothetical protein